MRIGIMGYGNLGRGIECAIKQNSDMELVAVFTRRDPASVSILTDSAKVCNVAEVEQWKDKIDVMILCGGSATDLPEQTPQLAKMFNVVDSFDTHAKIPEHFANVNAVAKESGHVAMISCGWDPGMFSLNRLYANCILPNGNDYTFTLFDNTTFQDGTPLTTEDIAFTIDYFKKNPPVSNSLGAGEKFIVDHYTIIDEKTITITVKDSDGNKVLKEMVGVGTVNINLRKQENFYG